MLSNFCASGGEGVELAIESHIESPLAGPRIAPRRKADPDDDLPPNALSQRRTFLDHNGTIPR
jgi:hypothetical protein